MSKVTKDMIISDVLQKYPDAAVVMLENGLHCVGCHANVFDTIEAGSKIHGLADDQIDAMVKDINAYLSDAKEEQKDLPEKIFLSENATAKIKEMLSSEKRENAGLKVAVSPGGCSGFVYQLSFEESPLVDDVVLEENGVKIFIDKDSLQMMRGANIDYVESLNESGFKIDNPNAKHGCGCGKSFG